ncbi:MAG: substrate-binding domain-containing protein [Gaiellaceae bacterium]
MRLPALLLLAIALLAASCSGDDGEEDETGAADAGALRIFAASSLQGVFEELAPEADFRFGSSDELSQAIVDGDVPDVFAAASQVPMAELQPEGILDPAVVFATNRLVLVVPAEGSAVESLDAWRKPSSSSEPSSTTPARHWTRSGRPGSSRAQRTTRGRPSRWPQAMPRRRSSISRMPGPPATGSG